MNRSYIALAPLALLLSTTLLGCSWDNLPSAVRMAIGHACSEKAGDAVDDLATSEETLGGGEASCAGLDQTKLTAHDVDCEKVSKKVVGWAATFECENNVADQVIETCGEDPTDECKSAVDTAVGAWELSKPDTNQEDQDEEEKEGFEAFLGLMNRCHLQSQEHLKDSDTTEVCGESNTDALQAMGVGSHCEKEYLRQQTIDTTFVCIDWVLHNPPDGAEDSEPSKELIDSVIDSFFKQDPFPPKASWEQERLRLYAMDALKAKRWPKLQTSSQAVKVGGVSMAALAALVVAGMWRRSRQVEIQDNQLLEDIE